MAYIDFDPKKHKGQQLYELQTQEEGKALVATVVPVDVPFEQASNTPWYYVVEVEGSDKQFPEPTPTGHALPPLREQPEITPEQVAEALRDWDAKAPRGWQGLLLTEKAEDGG